MDPLPRPVTILLQDIFCDIPGFIEDAMRLRLYSSKEKPPELGDLQTKIINAYVATDSLRWI
ncbi:hypothetical protein V2A60_008437 [Cordyceps javanica]